MLADYAAAEADLVEAYHRASQIGHDDLVVQVAAGLAEVTRERSAFADAWTWSRHAHDALVRLGGDVGQAALLQRIQARIRMAEGHPEAAEPLLRDALVAARAVYGATHLEVAETELELGVCLHRRGRHDDARPHIERAARAIGEEVGMDHPLFGEALNRQAGVLVSLHRLDDARALYEQTLAIALPTFGEGHPTTARALNNLGYIAMVQGNYERAAERFDRALAALSRIHGDDAPQLVIVLTNLAEVANERGLVEEAIGHYVRARAIVERKLGPEHPDMGRVCAGLGALYMSLGRADEAEPLLLRHAALVDRTREADDAVRLMAHTAIGQLRALQGRHEEALRIHDEVLAAFERSPPDNPDHMIDALVGVGEAQLALGAPALAVVPLARSMALRERQPEARPHELAARQFALARALPAEQRARARGLATVARDVYAAERRRSKELAAVEAWLARHR
jgi:tetratricopeptide (TPR) repeat protein